MTLMAWKRFPHYWPFVGGTTGDRWNFHKKRNSNGELCWLLCCSHEHADQQTLKLPVIWDDSHVDGFVQERRNSIANTLELRLSCTNPSIWRRCFVLQETLRTTNRRWTERPRSNATNLAWPLTESERRTSITGCVRAQSLRTPRARCTVTPGFRWIYNNNMSSIMCPYTSLIHIDVRSAYQMCLYFIRIDLVTIQIYSSGAI